MLGVVILDRKNSFKRMSLKLSIGQDLNPIENLWSIVKHNVKKRLPRNIDDLKQFMVKKIPESSLINLVEKNGKEFLFNLFKKCI